jgi:hypothetical protein
MIYGYARVSTDGQSVNAQVVALRKHGAGKVFREVASGVKTDRPQLRRLVSEIAAGDVVIVTPLDRLAQSTRDLLEHARGDHREKGRLPITRRRMGRRHHGARPLDDCRSRRAGGRGARSNPHPDSRRQKPRQGPRSAYGPSPFLDPAQQKEATRRRALRCRNWPTATTAAYPPCAA